MKRVFVSYLDHAVQSSEERRSLEGIKKYPQRPFIMERMGWLVYEDEIFIQLALERLKLDIKEEWSYSVNYTILKSTIKEMYEIEEIDHDLKRSD